MLTPQINTTIKEELPAIIEPGIYQHYKGDYYAVLFIARHTEAEEILVIYQSLYGDFKIWARPIAMFLDNNVEYKGVLQPRFKRVADSNEIEKFKKS